MTDLQTGYRILVVDDDPALRAAIGRRLRRADYQVVTAEDGLAALAHCEAGREPFDLVITDMHMPRMNGLDLAQALIEHRPLQRVVMITSDPDEALQRAALACGPVSFVPKPFELFELEEVVQQALSTRGYMRTPPPVAQRAYRGVAIGTVPAEWLLWVDERSNAGAGHADRVARMARIVAMSIPEPMAVFELAELEVAAWSHEIGLLAGPASNPVELAWRSADVLQECGSNEMVAAFVRHMHERWDGSGGPEGLVGDAIPLGAQILSVVDAIDHYCAAWLRTGMRPELAAHRAIGLAVTQQPRCFSPYISVLISGERETLRSICGVQRRDSAVNNSAMPDRKLPIKPKVEVIST